CVRDSYGSGLDSW
nr:immunoglobulin heavy chain junction region [Macaca mulatta]MOX58920.1 immunoglobulin heavy chain junction region [Macaca mulatta]MOX59007.1 immunoglobulin heavy chain junction region [Macaca mulatta]MOX59033.1 immunoglobulin heavy chain junction region [Macaca mulatta]MOX59774.1 immunoglobulin heavy chain junction region [Macaca mulatta]